MFWLTLAVAAVGFSCVAFAAVALLAHGLDDYPEPRLTVDDQAWLEGHVNACWSADGFANLAPRDQGTGA